MAQIHIGVIYDTETKAYSVCMLEEMPTDADHYVFDGDQWRKPTSEEASMAVAADADLSNLFESRAEHYSEAEEEDNPYDVTAERVIARGTGHWMPPQK